MTGAAGLGKKVNGTEVTVLVQVALMLRSSTLPVAKTLMLVVVSPVLQMYLPVPPDAVSIMVSPKQRVASPE
jgi:hypothetical protein